MQKAWQGMRRIQAFLQPQEGWEYNSGHTQIAPLFRLQVRTVFSPCSTNRRHTIMRSLLQLLALLVLLGPHPHSHALDPGTARGSLTVDGKVIAISSSHAHLHDNAEGLLDRPKELRILLADREVPESALAGLAFLPVTEMAKEGKVRGLLLELDPARPNSAAITLLYPPAAPGLSLPVQTISTTGPTAFKKLDIGKLRVTGEIEARDEGRSTPGDMPSFSYSIRFSTPLFHELAVTADLKGEAARNSIQAAVLRKKVEALRKRDWDALRKISSEKGKCASEAFIAQTGPEAAVASKAAADDLDRWIAGIGRVVVRGDRAVVIGKDKEWLTMVREGNAWKLDN